MNNLGRIESYIVNRETNLGYVLEKDGEEFFLHHNECNGKVLAPKERVKAFLYVDKKNRVAATLFPPIIQVGEVGLLKVVNCNHNLGVFFNIGISKDILLGADELPKAFTEWPQIDDYLICEMRIKANRLALKLANKKDIIDKCTKTERLKKDDIVTGYVYRITAEGINIITNEYEIVFIYRTNYRKNYRLGEKVEAKIIDIHDEDYSGSVNRNKVVQIQDDNKIILEYLEKNNGVMIITEKSSPELINHLFHMSKKAFKDALGSLLKNGKIEILENKIILKNYIN